MTDMIEVPQNQEAPKAKRRARAQLNVKPLVIPTENDWAKFKVEASAYSVADLKEIAKYHKLKRTATKPQLIESIGTYLQANYSAKRIQKCWARYAYRVYAQLRGPARFKRSLCVNECDIVTMDDLTEIPFHEFFSYQDDDGKIYGFDIESLYNLFRKSNDNRPLNPYTRAPVPLRVRTALRRLIMFSYFFNQPILFNANKTINQTFVVQPTTHEQRAADLFHRIDTLGFYTNAQWLLELNEDQLCLFVRYLKDIWHGRANLTAEFKEVILPAHRDPLRNLHVNRLRHMHRFGITELVLNIIALFISSGVEQEHKYVGATYVLMSLTLVNTNAARAMPWLFEAAS